MSDANGLQHIPAHAMAMPMGGQPSAEIMQLQQAMQQLHAQIQSLQQVQPSPGAPQPSNGSSSFQPRVERPRLPPPAFFDGKASALDEWVVELGQQFDWYASTESDKLRMAVAFLRGAARDWWTQLPVADKAMVTAWDALVAALRRRFQPVTTAELARNQLSKLAQGKSSVHDYVSAYRRLIIALPNMEEGDKLFAFTRGLRTSIGTQLRIHGVRTVEAAIEMAVRVGTVGEFAAAANNSSAAAAFDPMELDAIEGLESDSTATSSTSTASSSADGPVTRAEFQQMLAAMSDSRRSNASKQDRTGRRSEQKEGAGAGLPRFKVNGLSPQEIREHLDADKCFYCHKVGHQSRECNKKKKDEGK